MDRISFASNVVAEKILADNQETVSRLAADFRDAILSGSPLDGVVHNMLKVSIAISTGAIWATLEEKGLIWIDRDAPPSLEIVNGKDRPESDDR